MKVGWLFRHGAFSFLCYSSNLITGGKPIDLAEPKWEGILLAVLPRKEMILLRKVLRRAGCLSHEPSLMAFFFSLMALAPTRLL